MKYWVYIDNHLMGWVIAANQKEAEKFAVMKFGESIENQMTVVPATRKRKSI